MPRLNRPVNFNNFWRWYEPLGAPDVDNIPNDICEPESGQFQEFLPNFYRRNNKVSMPIVSPGELLSVQINFTANDPGETATNLRLAIVRNTTIVVDDVATITSLTSTSPVVKENFYFTYTPAVNSVPDGRYIFLIYRNDTRNIVYVSNEFEVVNQDFHEESVYLEYRNTSNYFNFLYTDLPTFYNRVRLRIARIDTQAEYEFTSYYEQSTGITREQKSRQRKIEFLEGDFFDEGMSDAIRSLSTHDTIMFNGVSYSVKTGYNVNPNRQNNVWRGVIEVYNEDYSVIGLHG